MIINRMIKHNNLLVFIFFILAIFFINISIEYSKYQELIDEEIFETKVEVLNVYNKKKFDVVKLKNKDFIFFTNFEKNDEITQFDKVNIAFITTKINFIDYLRGFYTKTIYFEKIYTSPSISENLANISDSQHYNEMIQELFRALFLAIPISTELRDICANYGISHLIALSGFHLSVLSFLVYWILYFPYSFFHTRYFPFRNKKFDLLMITLFILFFYLILTNIVPSLLRAFVLMSLGIYLLRSNIRLFSFNTLFIVLLIVIALFPEYIFSISLWFSIMGVFYIYLFIHYFSNMKNRIFQVLFFNFWIYLAMNPIVHYFFPVTTYEQLISPFITLGFTLFYPFELFLHIIGYGGLLDKYLIQFLNYKFEVFDVVTALWFFLLYIFFSFLSIFKEKAFVILNFLLFGFTIYMYI